MIHDSSRFILPLAAVLFTAAALPGRAAEADAAAAAGSLTAISADTVRLHEQTYMGERVEVPAADYKASPDPWWKTIRASGSVQTEFHFAEYEPGFSQVHYKDKVRNNTYFDLTLSARYISIGGRFEFSKWPLPQFDNSPEMEGWGVPYFWATGGYKWFQVTAGDFYEQFGSGLILRSYQERAMGIDGALRGGRLKLNPVSGLSITGLVGKQRYYWEHNPALIWGADAEWSLDETFSKAFADPYGLSLGFSYVGRHEKQSYQTTSDGLSQLYFPVNTAAFDGRANLRFHNFNLLVEGAWKNNDPNQYNFFTYGTGHAELITLSYSQRGISAFIQAKRSENMKMNSDRMQADLQGNGAVNFLPPFSMTQTYTLAALYPYSTQYDGEWAFQAEVGYLFKKGTPLGGRYGTNVRLSASYISGLDRMPNHMVADPPFGSDGYKPAFWKIGSLYYADLNFEVKKKFSKKLQFTLFYLFQKYNLFVIQGHGSDMLTANTFVLEGQWKIRNRTQLRWELSYLTTKQDDGDWMSALVELSLAPHWMFTFTDTYNNGKTKENYYKAMVSYSYRANRFTLSYGRTRAGFDCSGGVCRKIPSTKGFSLTYAFTF